MNTESIRPLPIEPVDKVWGIGVSGIEAPSPFPRVNELLRWTKLRDSTADSQRAMIVTEGYKKYAMYPANVMWGLILRDIFTKVDIHIWPGELIVGELAAEPCGAPIYPEFSYDWLCREFEANIMEARKNDRYVISDSVKKDILSAEDFWKNRTLGEAWEASLSPEEKAQSHMEKAINRSGLYVYAGVGHVCAHYEKLFSIGFGGLKKQIEERLSSLDCSDPADISRREFYQAELYALGGASSYIRRYDWYAMREMQDYMDYIRGASTQIESGKKIMQQRRKKFGLYYKAPMFLRAQLWFIYNYFFRLGFLDGREGFLYHYFECLWYRMLVDAKIFEQQKTNRPFEPLRPLD